MVGSRSLILLGTLGDRVEPAPQSDPVRWMKELGSGHWLGIAPGELNSPAFLVCHICGQNGLQCQEETLRQRNSVWPVEVGLVGMEVLRAIGPADVCCRQGATAPGA